MAKHWISIQRPEPLSTTQSIYYRSPTGYSSLIQSCYNRFSYVRIAVLLQITPSFCRYFIMPPNPSNGYAPSAYGGDGNVTPSKNDSTMRLLTNSENGSQSTSPLNRSSYESIKGPRQPGESTRSAYQPAPTTDSEISSILRDVGSDLSSSTQNSRAARYKAAKVRFESRDKGPVASSQMSDSGPPSPLSRSYQPSDPPSPLFRQASVLQNAPVMNAPAYSPFRPSSRAGRSPTRPVSPVRSDVDYTRAPSTMPYEPADINGAPRPGTPSSAYGGSPKRPLPPAPLF